MREATGTKRTDTASRIICATPHAVFDAFVNPDALIAWLPPEGMTGHVHVFEPHQGGNYRLALYYDAADHSTPGKSSEHTDIVSGRFLEIVPDKRIVQAVDFESDDAAFAGTMIITWSWVEVPSGTKVTVVCEDVPYGIGKKDHDEGLKSTLENLANYLK
ncbi:MULTISPECIES: SRPBCC domain-containing protein [unclassified Rhizobium]|uniref:SRPBCC domain-containing protein n=1 Tax=unclassified Rhizobium TaxID=2613769 RepID=UPI000EAA5A71|nr:MULTISPECIES: SRPBCC domain-containing protein [unclassified Rhizobium]AYG66264.1 ATPase [Rhizobium sp. CCGE531]AYG72646.1 ATPase [Rhizobium sp. CCGE532]